MRGVLKGENGVLKGENSSRPLRWSAVGGFFNPEAPTRRAHALPLVFCLAGTQKRVVGFLVDHLKQMGMVG